MKRADGDTTYNGNCQHIHLYPTSAWQLGAYECYRCGGVFDAATAQKLTYIGLDARPHPCYLHDNGGITPSDRVEASAEHVEAVKSPMYGAYDGTLHPTREAAQAANEAFSAAGGYAATATYSPPIKEISGETLAALIDRTPKLQEALATEKAAHAVADNFADAPQSIGELRAFKSSDATDWTPREALVYLLREIDSGRINVTDLILCYDDKGGENRGWVNACRSPEMSSFLLTRTQHRLMILKD
jgi:hypothetical protein